jgi:PTH1 family peptidyl-tRNA hydrolase
MKLIVGLGNPGEKYQRNRHNAGFIAVDSLVVRLQTPNTSPTPFAFVKKFEAEMLQSGDFLFAKPQTYMNDSGRSVAAITRFYKIDPKDLYLLYDDLDIELGKYKLVFDSCPKVHNGVNSVIRDLGTKAFWHGRVGVENRPIKGNKGVAGMTYSLQDLGQHEQEVFVVSIAGLTAELASALIHLQGQSL